MRLLDSSYRKWYNLTDFSRLCDKKFPVIQPPTASSWPEMMRPLVSL